MMKARITTSIVLYGGIDSLDSNKWLEFYKYASEFIQSINLDPNYMAFSSETIKSSKIASLKTVEKKLYKAIENNEEISSISIYSLPDNFETAAFDYNVYICRTNRLKCSHIIITLPSELFRKIDHNGLIVGLKKFVDFKEGEIFNLSNLESPHLYASKANAPTVFKTLDMISSF